ncbi:MAG: hypothetical protein RJA70_435 [Pseudomonadota bacterium]
MRKLDFTAALVALAAQGCLDAAPSYDEPQRTPPFIIKSQVIPALNAVVKLAPGESMDISVPFRSEDLGANVLAVAYLDVRPGKPTTAVYLWESPASTFDDLSRTVRGPVSNIGAAGCHTVTLVVSHDFNVRPDRVVDESRADRIVWWVDVKDPQGERTLLDDCITEGVEQP